MKSAIRSSFPLPITLANHHYAEECVNFIILLYTWHGQWITNDLMKKILLVTAIYKNLNNFQSYSIVI